MEETKGRYVGIDLGKRTYTVATVGKRGAVTMSSGKTTVEGRQALYRKLEAGNLAFIMAKEMAAAVGCEVRVLSASNLALIYGTMKETDKEDVLLSQRSFKRAGAHSGGLQGRAAAGDAGAERSGDETAEAAVELPDRAGEHGCGH